MCTTNGTYQIQDSHVASPLARFRHLALGRNGPCKDVCVYEYAGQEKHEPLSNKIDALSHWADPSEKNLWNDGPVRLEFLASTRYADGNYADLSGAIGG